MNSIVIRTQVDEKGRIELHMPPQCWGQTLELIVVYEAVDGEVPDDRDSPDGWPTGVYAATAGAWQGELLVREPQGEYEVRDSLP